MNQCWPEGALRAYLDDELPAAQMRTVAAHLEACPACERLRTELSARAASVAGWMDTLVEPGVTGLPVAPRPAVAPRPILVRARTAGSWRWTGAAVALAAGLAVASFFAPKPDAPRAQIARETPPPEVPLPVVTPREAQVVPETVEQPRVQTRLAAAKPRRPALRTEHFLALDDEPIESGIIMRVTLPGSTPADIVFSPDGRARAIRLVNGTQNR
jgi:anti-sigma factor RsiW